eukprot:COSAG05_NODE_2754_length_2682_cov_1.552846_1_plen_87_part_10
MGQIRFLRGHMVGVGGERPPLPEAVAVRLVDDGEHTRHRVLVFHRERDKPYLLDPMRLLNHAIRARNRNVGKSQYERSKNCARVRHT